MCFKSHHPDQHPPFSTGKTQTPSFHNNDEMDTNSFLFYPSQGEMTEAIKYLEKFVVISRNNFKNLDVIQACTMLGDIYNEKVSAVSFVWKSLQRLKSVLSLNPPSQKSVWKIPETAGCSPDPRQGVELERSLSSICRSELSWVQVTSGDHCHSVYQVTDCEEQCNKFKGTLWKLLTVISSLWHSLLVQILFLFLFLF